MTLDENATLSPPLDETIETPGAEQVSYRVTFDRIGRQGGKDGTRPPGPLTARVLDAGGLADRIYDFARPFLRSREVDVLVDLDEMAGHILCGFHTGGSFTIERLDGEG